MEVKYREIGKYKYLLEEEYLHPTRIVPSNHLDTDYVALSLDGVLVVKKEYAWDGASGPAIDTKSFIRSSLVHDALYQLISLGLLNKKYRKAADKLLYKICREDGMGKFRAWYVYSAVRWFGGSHC